MICIDHFALAAQTLEIGQEYIRKLSGLTIPLGGVHQGMGTHNCLMATGDDSYLEIIANDPNQPTPDRPRPFDLDNAEVVAKTAANPHIQTVILRTCDAARDIRKANNAGVDLGNIVDAARGDLKWLLVMREDRTLALNGTAPPLIEWSNGPHVSQSMPNKGLILIKLTIAAPDADALNALFKAIDVQDDRLGVEYAAIKKITATLQLPSGQKIKIG